MDTGIVAALAALGGAVGGKLLDVVLGWRKVGVDQEAATRAWYTTEFAKLREEITKQDAKIEALEIKVDNQRTTIRLHEDTIATQNRTIVVLQDRVKELEGRSQAAPQQIDLNVKMGNEPGC